MEWPRPSEDIVEEWPLPREGPMTEEQVNVEPPNVDCANSSSEKAPLVATAGFLIIGFNFKWLQVRKKTREINFSLFIGGGAE